MKHIAESVGLPLRSLTPRPANRCGTGGRYWLAIYHAPDDLGTLMAYSTYAARIAKLGGDMARWGVNLEDGTIEIVFSVPESEVQPLSARPTRRRYPKFPAKSELIDAP